MRIHKKDSGKIYVFLGIGGFSMSALAKYALSTGAEVYGYDAVRSERCAALERLGVKIFYGDALCEEEKSVINRADEIVCTSAIVRGNARFDECEAQGKNILDRGDYLSRVASSFPECVAVAGSHGKTTCTAMCAHIFRAAKRRFCAHVGGEDSDLGNFCFYGDEIFLTEACEYKKNLLKLAPTLSLLLNVDLDHLECYEGVEDLVRAFSDFCAAGKRGAIVCADDERSVCARLTEKYTAFGIENQEALYTAKNLRLKSDGGYTFSLCEGGKELCEASLRVAGKCHVYNALAAFSAARFYGISAEDVVCGLSDFRGVRRRFEKICVRRGVAWYCDYAHHPREISAALDTASAIIEAGKKQKRANGKDASEKDTRQKYREGKFAVVFQPHTYSRTKALFSEFCEVLSPIASLAVYETYAAREEFDEKGSASRLSRAVGAKYLSSEEGLREWIEEQENFADVILFLGAGDIYEKVKILSGKQTKSEPRISR